VTGSLAAGMAAIDAANADDPTTVEVDGRPEPLAQAHGELAAAWVRRLDPAATDVQLLAARAHHLRRWASPRDAYPDGRAGYLRWRTAAKRHHAEEVAGLLAGAGYGDDEIERVQRIIRKEGLGRDPAVQVHEDAVCLAFLETQLEELAESLGDDKTVDVLARTLAKMSPVGIDAVAEIALSDRGAALVRRAVELRATGGESTVEDGPAHRA
jgi:hypothetical protein